MPIYEYRCQDCHQKSSVFVRSVISSPSPTCGRCGSFNLVRLMSTFSVATGGGRSEDSGEEGLPAGMDDVDEKDPRSLGRWMRRMKDEVGEEGGPEFDEMVSKLEAGDVPEELSEGESGLDDADDSDVGEA